MSFPEWLGPDEIEACTNEWKLAGYAVVHQKPPDWYGDGCLDDAYYEEYQVKDPAIVPGQPGHFLAGYIHRPDGWWVFIDLELSEEQAVKAAWEMERPRESDQAT